MTIRGSSGSSGRVLTALACLGLLTGCGQAATPAGPNPSIRASGTASGTVTETTSPPGKAGATAFVKHASFLRGISCPSASSCVAVGWHYYGAADHAHPLIERWNGTAWQVQAPPPDGRDGTLAGVSCTSVDDCTAVGSLILGWNGRQWRVERRATSFDSVSCPARGRCVAVGVTRSGTPVAGTWNGSAWRVSPMPDPPRRAESVTLASISCPAPTACLAVGDYASGASARPSPRYRDRILAEHWDGRAWRLVPALDVARRNKLAAVSCTGPRQCMAVGSASGRVALAESWDGVRWHAERTGNLNPIGYSELTGVSCTAAARCMAVGDYNLAVPFYAQDRDAVWNISAMARPAGQPGTSGLAVSCFGSACVATGTNAGEALTELWKGKAWQLLTTPNPR